MQPSIRDFRRRLFVENPDLVVRKPNADLFVVYVMAIRLCWTRYGDTVMALVSEFTWTITAKVSVLLFPVQHRLYPCIYAYIFIHVVPIYHLHKVRQTKKVLSFAWRKICDAGLTSLLSKKLAVLLKKITFLTL